MAIRTAALREDDHRLSTLLISHPACAAHDPGVHHPESPARLLAVMAALADPAFEGLLRREAPLADVDDIARVHPRAFVERLLAAVPKAGRVPIDPDTLLSPQSGEASRRAAGAVLAAIDAVFDGEALNAFCAVRPPGHHAEPDQAMGFCLFNSIAVGARHAQAVHGVDRVAIVDFDVHHGNGSQAVALEDRSIFYASSHQYPHYPGTGAATETGFGNIVNVPLRAGTEGASFRRQIEARILPALDAFQPELILVSAGFDAHKADPLASIELVEADFAWITERLTEAAARHCGGRLVSVLEGGYDLGALAASAAAHVAALQRARQ